MKFRYTIPVEVVVTVDGPDPDDAAEQADALVTSWLSTVMGDDHVTATPPIDLPEPEEEI